MQEILWALSKTRNLADMMNLEVFLVGGFVRDIFLGEQNKDVDLLVNGPCLEFAQKLAGEVDGSFISLSTEHEIYRVVIKRLRLQLDITRPAGGQFLKDLCRRDFTCNAIALNVKDYLENNSWWEKAVDPTFGLEDLARRQLRPVGTDSFSNDPVRIIRGLRLAVVLGLQLDKKYHDYAYQAAPLLSKVAGERIKQELWLLLGQFKAYQHLQILDSWQVLETIFPQVVQLKKTEQNCHHAENAWAHSLRTLKALEEARTYYLPEPFKTIASDYLAEQLTVGGTRLQLLKLATLFHDVGKIDTAVRRPDGRITFHNHQRLGVKYIEQFADRLALGKRERQCWSKVTALHMRPLSLFVQSKVTDKAYLRFFQEAGADTAMVLLLSYADVKATRQAKALDIEPEFEKFILEMWEKYLRFHRLAEENLVTGMELKECLKLDQGTLVGKLQEEIKQARWEGKISNKQEALTYASRLLEGERGTWKD
ncbi:HDIG domain-containing protein [Metallumcola ferriviriculae]|uniref:HDIG domain-containing protein n=1 Tax=Metallumcola ferriviriculae TaxID=3039180 RepID=A0AAU0ULQ3_9FIRM|nr:HDIG domain-containing protein [Desulfitibacteraceae bacterium MK1]